MFANLFAEYGIFLITKRDLCLTFEEQFIFEQGEIFKNQIVANFQRK
jgi:hypothetical protein